MKPWTQEEVDYLQQAWGDNQIPYIAKKLGRSVNAIKLKAGRIGLKRHIHSGEYITVSQLSKAIDHNYWTVCNWEKYGLNIKRKKSIQKSYKIIYIEDFWKWAETHKQLVHFDRIERLTLGKEPKWVAEARRADSEGKTRREKWKPNENDRLIHLLNEYKYSIREIAADLGRTEGAVKRHIVDLGLKQRPVRQIDHLWTESQIAQMYDMLGRGYSFEQIGIQLGRTGTAVRRKYEQLENPEYVKKYRQGKRGEGYNVCAWRKQKEGRNAKT